MRKKIYILTSALIISALIFSGCNNNQKETQAPTTSPTASTVENTATNFNQLDKPVSGDTIAIINTSMGTIKIRLFAAYAPKAVENFIGLSKKGYYNGLIFHRVIKDFMIQSGDPNGNGTGGESIWGKPFKDEFSPNVLNYRGALSMANSGSNTNGSQFFIVQSKSISSDLLTQMKQAGYPQNIIDTYKKNGGTPWLDGKHTVFGEVYEGMNVVDKIANVKTDKNDKPIKAVKVKTIKIETIK